MNYDEPSSKRPRKSTLSRKSSTSRTSHTFESLDDPSRARATSTTYRPELRSSEPDHPHRNAILAQEMVDAQALEPPPGSFRAFYQRNKGLFYVLLAQVFGVLMNVTTRLLEIEGNRGAGMHPFQILFVRMAITTLLSTLYMWWSKTPQFPLGAHDVRWLLILRGVGGFFGVFGMYYSLLYLPLADATVLTFITPSLSCWVCSKLLKEPFTRLEQLGAIISFFGVTLIARPTTFFPHPASDSPAPAPAPPAIDTHDGAASTQTVGVADLNTVNNSQRLGAIFVALTGVLGSATAFVAMRWIGKRAHPLLSVNYFCAIVTVVSALAMAVLPNVQFLLPADTKEWVYLIFLGCCGFAMQFLLSAGLQHEKSSRATLMTYTQMLFALVFDKLVFGNNPALTSVLGSLLIVGSAIYIALQKGSAKQRAEADKIKQEEGIRANGGTRMEMVEGPRGTMSRDEERGLVANMDGTGEEERERGSQRWEEDPRVGNQER